ncbi:hypothetical protein [Brevibacillus dissolubilis]|uniref:hypothetical protein n=1 Tax=Brevibacillus dissolubilis TaxID=1844116 RepID=UPI0011179CC0|nr:hypothetical protein [Brevibacillus dissolubilis]
MPAGTDFTLPALLAAVVINCGMMVIYIEPIRKRSWIINRMFVSFDRPEDRPHTLLWLVTQLLGMYVVMIPFFLFFQSLGYMALAIIPILINGLGDGLAEPVGVKWGKHKYQVRALFSTKKYWRSIEGSACVFIASVLILIGFSSSFTGMQLTVALLTLPILMTLTEAFSPHTWDTPFLLLVGFVTLYLVKLI